MAKVKGQKAGEGGEQAPWAPELACRDPTPALPVAEHVTRGSDFILCLSFPNWRRGTTSTHLSGPSPTFRPLAMLGVRCENRWENASRCQAHSKPTSDGGSGGCCSEPPAGLAALTCLPGPPPGSQEGDLCCGLHVRVPPDPFDEAWTLRVAVSGDGAAEKVMRPLG